MTGYVYVMASRRNGTIYTGVTDNLRRRAAEHQQGIGSKFTAKYGCKILVYYEFHERIEKAIERESQIKAWKRDWKLELIEAKNPQWKDLCHELM